MKMIREFFKLESSAGILLGVTTILALVMVNSPLRELYNALLTTPVIVQISEFVINKPLLLWINDGLMVIFFFLIGLEIKREIIEGQLSTWERLSLPAIAAFGGVLIPSLIYIYFNFGDNKALYGWAIPAATDIAFSLGILSILGSRIPDTLKVCLVAIAIIDDLAAILIIAIFYTDSLSFFSLVLAFVGLPILAIFNRRGVTNIAPYAVVGVILWACVLKSGVHATLSGVILAMFIPLKAKNVHGKSPLRELEHSLHPWVAYCVVPIFAFANAGVCLKGLSFEVLVQPITLGIFTGLFLGKQIGIILFSYVGVKCKICRIPSDISWRQYYGMALLAGIGFSMSLFIGTLAFQDIESQTAVRLGVLSGSLISGILGYVVLRLSSVRPSL